VYEIYIDDTVRLICCCLAVINCSSHLYMPTVCSDVYLMP